MRSCHNFVRRLLLLVALVVIGTPALAQGREGRTLSQSHMTRAELQELLASFEQVTRTPVRDDEMRARARYEASLIRTRLQEGDFQTGDRIFMRVAGEPALTDTFVVNRHRAVELPVIGHISLHGVLRSELDDHMTEQLSRHIRDPLVRTSTTIRLQIMGSVGRPGFFVMPTELLLTDALMLAGGPHTNAHLDQIRVERGRERIWSGSALQQAIIEGRTLDQLNLQAGDRIVVPQRTNWLRSEYIQTTSYLVTTGFALYHLYRIIF